MNCTSKAGLATAVGTLCFDFMEKGLIAAWSQLFCKGENIAI